MRKLILYLIIFAIGFMAFDAFAITPPVGMRNGNLTAYEVRADSSWFELLDIDMAEVDTLFIEDTIGNQIKVYTGDGTTVTIDGNLTVTGDISSSGTGLATQAALEDTANAHTNLINLKLNKTDVRDSIYVGLAASDSSKFPAGKLSLTNMAAGGSYTANVLTANSFAYTTGNTPHFIKSYPTIPDSIYCSVHDSLDVLPVYSAAVDDTSKRIQFKSIGAVRDTLRLGDIMIPPIASYDSVIVFVKFSDADSANAKIWIKIYNAGETILQTTVDGTVANTFERFAYPITADFDPNEEYKLEYTAILNTTLSCEITGIRLKCAD